ncbi:MAG: permease prefix domain 1-containing protein [Sphaerochaeta sp.]|uniref:DUF4153 domain-containing protein n=1 Tax=Candidatus Wallbacteria bacterium HGW-Wallbacteria-1 TaxID=2013854 RepID=A0A2N1PI30_9BACT|nr:permease prefix domain 1-containing protein [Sphaerochaeta sp.]PKK87984.1 MAG: hypothetical protein CVV64_20780 [Candidatus Wallbacteria bacterium HGW-Wallbacteria-1]
MFDLESQIRQWKTHVYSTGSIGQNDMEELESHLRDSMDELTDRGLSTEEAFLLAVRRMGDIEVIHEEFSKISTEDLWRQLLVPTDNPITARRNRKELGIVIGLALLGGLLSKIPALFGYGDMDVYSLLYLRNASIFAFFPVAIYLIWKRSLPILRSLLVLSIFPSGALLVNVYPSYEPHHTGLLLSLHLPMLLLFVLLYFFGGPAINREGQPLYATGWRNPNTRLNFVRFVGESFIYAILIGMGGMVLIALTTGTFDLIKIDAFPFITAWIAPFGFFGLFIVAAYLVIQKKNLIESIAPVLARIFTPLFLLVLISLIVAFLITPNQAYENRNMLIWFDIILALVLALTLYSMSSKDFSSNNASAKSQITFWDFLSFGLIISAVIVDTIALSGISMRLSAYGFSANRTAALGENLILLVNLLLLCVGYVRYFLQRQTFQAIVVMQMRFLSVYGVWAACVVIVFPLLFGFR